MKLNILDDNLIEVNYENDNKKILISYSTPVAIYSNQTLYILNKPFQDIITQHINYWANHLHINKVFKVDDDTFDELLDSKPKISVKINPIRLNMTELVYSNGNKILVSYWTPVAAYDKNFVYIINKKISKATSRHINEWVKMLKPETNKIIKVNKNFLNRFIEE